MPDGIPSRISTEIAARRERVREDDPLIAATYATGHDVRPCKLCGDRTDSPEQTCARCVSESLDGYEGGAYRAEKWQDASDREWRDG